MRNQVLEFQELETPKTLNPIDPFKGDRGRELGCYCQDPCWGLGLGTAPHTVTALQ